MIDYIGNNADTITAVVAVLGLFVAVWLGIQSLRSTRDAVISDDARRSEDRLEVFLAKVAHFQHAALTPYWKANPDAPVEPGSQEALALHTAIAEVSSNAGFYASLSLRAVKNELDDVRSAVWTLYFEAISNSPSEVRIWKERRRHAQEVAFGQPREDAICEVKTTLRQRGARDEFLSLVRDEVNELYEGHEELCVMQVADVALTVACDRLVQTFRDCRPRQGAGIPERVR